MAKPNRPSRGWKKCDNCGEYLPVRVKKCECGNEIKSKSKKKIEQALEEAGSCPISIKKKCAECDEHMPLETGTCSCGSDEFFSLSLEDVEIWADELSVYAKANKKKYPMPVLLKFVGEHYDEFSQNYQNVRQHLLTINSSK